MRSPPVWRGPSTSAVTLGTAGDEAFHATAHGEPIVDHRATPWVDGSRVTCRRWNWRKVAGTAIHERTTTVGFIIR